MCNFQFSSFDSQREMEMGERILFSTLMKVMSFFFLFLQSPQTIYILERKRENKANRSFSPSTFISLRIFSVARKSRTGQRRIELQSFHYIFALCCQSRVESTAATRTDMQHSRSIISCAVHKSNQFSKSFGDPVALSVLHSLSFSNSFFVVVFVVGGCLFPCCYFLVDRFFYSFVLLSLSISDCAPTFLFILAYSCFICFP